MGLLNFPVTLCKNMANEEDVIMVNRKEQAR